MSSQSSTAQDLSNWECLLYLKNIWGCFSRRPFRSGHVVAHRDLYCKKVQKIKFYVKLTCRKWNGEALHYVLQRKKLNVFPRQYETKNSTLEMGKTLSFSFKDICSVPHHFIFGTLVSCKIWFFALFHNINLCVQRHALICHSLHIRNNCDATRIFKCNKDVIVVLEKW